MFDKIFLKNNSQKEVNELDICEKYIGGKTIIIIYFNG